MSANQKRDIRQARRDYDFLKTYELTAMAAFRPGRDPDLNARKWLLETAMRTIYPKSDPSKVWRTLWLRWYRKDGLRYMQREDEP